VNSEDADLIADPLFVGATRPAMRWGVTYTAILVNLVFTMEVFLLTKNLLTLLLGLPIHGLCLLLCAREARYFELVGVWLRTKGLAVVGNGQHWQSSSYSPLMVSRAARALRRHPPSVRS
jgi:type IV secretion system protein VirB3